MESRQTNDRLNEAINLNLSAVQPANLSNSLPLISDELSVFELDGAVEGDTIRVLLVDGNKESLIATARMLAVNSYQVTMVVSGSIAMKTILAGKKQFDMVIIDVDLPDINSFNLCKEVEKTGILVVVTSTKDDPEVTYKSLSNGACILVKKPVEELSMKYLHQFMIKQRIHKNRKGLDGEMGSVDNISSAGILITGSTSETAWKKRKYHRKNGAKEGATNPPNLNAGPSSVEFYNKRKMCIEWTKELHQKFMDAVNQLGEGNCYPKEILELMNVSGLTRMQVASHLQKCRYDNWRSPTERKKQSRKRRFCAPTTIAHERAHERVRVFGSMPQVDHKLNTHFVPLPLFGNKPLAFGNGALSNFKTPIAYYSEKENASQRWMEHIHDPLWATRILNPASHAWTLPPPAFNNSAVSSTSYNSILMAGDGVAHTKEAVSFVPTMKMPDAMTSEFLTGGDEEMNFLLPEFPNFSLDNKFENCGLNHRDEVNHLQWMESRANEVTGNLGNAGMASTSARRVIKDF